MSALSTREKQIRVGGFLFLISPFCNFLITALLHLQSGTRFWSFVYWGAILRSSGWIGWLLDLSSLTLGALMIKGRRSSWAPVLVLLAIFVLHNAYTFRTDMRTGLLWPLTAMIINCGAFALVYMQEFHQQVHGFLPKMPERLPIEREKFSNQTINQFITPPVAQPSVPQMPVSLIDANTRTPAPQSQPVVLPQFNTSTPQLRAGRDSVFSFRLPMRVSFSNFAFWGELTQLSGTELRIRPVSESLPKGIETEMCEFLLPTDSDPLPVRAQFSGYQGSELVFKIANGLFERQAS